MADLPESATYETGIYQLETTDPVQGGASGVANTQARQLANRTAWLKDVADQVLAAKGANADLTAGVQAMIDAAVAAHADSGAHDDRYATPADVQTVDDALAIHKSSGDHDGRYALIGALNAVSSDLSSHKTSADHDGRYAKAWNTVRSGTGINVSGDGELRDDPQIAVDSSVVRWNSSNCIEFYNVEATGLTGRGQVGYDGTEGLFAYHDIDAGGDRYYGPDAYLVADAANLKGGWAIEIHGGRGKDSGPIEVRHADTSSQVDFWPTLGIGRVVTGLKFDGHGHVTDLQDYDLDDRYYTKAGADSRFARKSEAFPGVYGGTLDGKTDFPVGTTVLVDGNSGDTSRNRHRTAYLLEGDKFTLDSNQGGGSALSGTWACRGNDDDAVLIQRIA